MSATLSSRGLVSRTSVAIIDLMHGGLVMAGIILSLALAAFVAGHPTAVEAVRAVRNALLVAPPANVAEADIPAAAPATEQLRADLRAARDHVAKRYRVSAVALESVFRAAQSEARALNIDPLLIIAVIGVESGFNPLSESVMGAQGLMQIMPRFHRDKLPPGDDASAFFDPETNVSIGARILKDSIRRMGSVAAGLQQFAGAADDPDLGYSRKVLAEKARLEAAARAGRGA